MKFLKITFIFLFLFFSLVISFMFIQDKNKTKNNEEITTTNNLKEEEINIVEGIIDKNISIAVCPTFHYFFNDFKNFNKINLIETKSTSESLALIKKGVVDLIISGRPLKDEEPDLLFSVIGDGYDFIYKNEIVISEEDMINFLFFTDLDYDKIINDFSYISKDNLIKMEEPLNYIEEGIAITFIEKYLIGGPVHILKKDQSRVILSRLPRIYYLSDIEQEKISFIKNILEEKEY